MIYIVVCDGNELSMFLWINFLCKKKRKKCMSRNLNFKLGEVDYIFCLFESIFRFCKGCYGGRR